MLDVKFIRSNVEIVKEAARNKGVDVDIDRIVSLDASIRNSISSIEAMRKERKDIARLYAKTSDEEKVEASIKARALADKIAAAESEEQSLQSELNSLLLITPNIPDVTAPIGPDARSNVVVRKIGELPRFDFQPIDHVDLLQARDWGDLKKTTEISGSRTYSLKNALVRLELALINFALDRLAAEGFTPITVPPFAREQALMGTGHFPLGREDAYRLGEDDLYLIGTSEVILNSLHSNEILDEAALPILYAGYSGCFRREAGSSGRDVRGLLRVHHFTKVEQFVLCRNDPEESRRWHEKLLRISEDILSALELPYQVIECCTGDMGLGKVRMHDIETWVPSQEAYRETHSCSTLHEWQARRTNTRYRQAGTKQIQYVHTLNNTAIATPRIFVPLLENHQRRDGRVHIPKALRPYMMGQEVPML